MKTEKRLCGCAAWHAAQTFTSFRAPLFRLAAAQSTHAARAQKTRSDFSKPRIWNTLSVSHIRRAASPPPALPSCAPCAAALRCVRPYSGTPWPTSPRRSGNTSGASSTRHTLRASRLCTG
eukprot:7946716-Pyramimonas_sp.AAC.1